MPDSSDDGLEEELRELEAEVAGEDEGTSDAPDLDDLEADVGGGEPGSDVDSLAAEIDGESAGDVDVGLDRDASEEYADLLDGGATSADTGAPADGVDATSADAGAADADDGGLLSGVLGGSSSTDAEADGAPATGAGDVGADAATTDAAEEAASSGGRLPSVRELFLPRAFLAAAVAMAVAGGVGRTFVPLIGGPFGLWIGAFLVGLASSDGRYVEHALAGALVGAAGAFAGGISIAVASGATERLLAIGAVAGLVLAVVGHYFGRDLRLGILGGLGSPEESGP